MTECFDQGQLRAYLLTGEDSSLEAHLSTCPACREQLAELRAVQMRVAKQITMLAPDHTPDSAASWHKMQATLAWQAATTRPDNPVKMPTRAPDLFTNQNRRPIMQTFANTRSRTRRTLYSGLTAMLVVGALAVPSVRATAEQILQTFRAESATFVSVDPNRVSQLMSDVDPSSLFLTRPALAPGTMERNDVLTAAEAAKTVGFTPEQVTALPGAQINQKFSTYSSGSVSFTVDVAKLRELLKLLNITDVTLPNALGAQPITADIPAFMVSSHAGSDYTLTLAQGRSPEVHLPPGVELAQLGKSALRVVGLSEAEADRLSKQINWASTLVVPFPAGASDFKQVQVGNVPGLLVESDAMRGAGSRIVPSDSTLLYWQQGDHFYVLSGTGSAASEQALLDAAKSVK